MRGFSPPLTGGRPARGFAFNAPHPPARYSASHLYIVRLVILSVRATTSGLSPSCTLCTARIRSASSVGGPAYERHLFSCGQRIRVESPRQEKYDSTNGLINSSRCVLGFWFVVISNL